MVYLLPDLDLVEESLRGASIEDPGLEEGAALPVENVHLPVFYGTH
jgi:hypothetical protein